MPETITPVPNLGVNEEAKIRELVAKSTKFYQRWESFNRQVDTFCIELRGLKNEVVQLLNAREALDRKVKDSELLLAKNNEEAQKRLASVEQGHRALIDRLSKQEMENRSLKMELDKKEAHLNEKIREVEMLRHHFEQKMASLTEVTKGSKKQ